LTLDNKKGASRVGLTNSAKIYLHKRIYELGKEILKDG
jgi:hypothetical protein